MDIHVGASEKCIAGPQVGVRDRFVTERWRRKSGIYSVDSLNEDILQAWAHDGRIERALMKIPNENELIRFFRSYFHQDWDLEAQDWRGVAREFAENESESYVSAVLGGLEVIARSGLDSGDLQNLLSQRLGCGNNPNWGEPLSEWFSDLASELQVALAGRASQS